MSTRAAQKTSMRRSGTVSLLDVDPDLGAAIPTEELELARRLTAAPVLELSPPSWDPGPLAGLADDSWLGVWILDGVLLRLVKVGPRSSCELLGPGDVVRPWDGDGQYDPLPVEVDFRVLEPTRLAVLNGAFAQRVARWPRLGTLLLTHATRRARYLTLNAAVAHLPGVQARLLILFWLLGERWGKMTADGVQISLPLTHEVLAMLVGARRPTVTVALARLEEAGLLHRRAPRTWLLSRAAIERVEDPAQLASALLGQSQGQASA